MNALRSVACIAFYCMVIYSCKKEDAIPATTTHPVAPPATVNKSLLLQLVNNVRQAGCNCGNTTMPAVGTVTWNTTLEKAAVDHSKDMNAKNYFSHTGLNGSTAGDRITNAGYTWSTYGENIAKGYANENDVMQGWLSSEGHCKNIMNKNFKEMGVGKDGTYWTQVFATK